MCIRDRAARHAARRRGQGVRRRGADRGDQHQGGGDPQGSHPDLAQGPPHASPGPAQAGRGSTPQPLIAEPGGFASTIGSVKALVQRPKVGFVLSGGGSRGAYEAGIIHYLRTDLAKQLGRHVPIDIVSGTSVGAINAAFLAATMADPDAQAEQLTAAWRALRIEELISLRPIDVLRAARLMLG